MTTLLRLLLLLLMGCSLLAARWTDSLGQRPAAVAARPRPVPVGQARAYWLLGSSWQGWGRPVGQKVPPGRTPVARAL